jgi:N-acetylmuramoyl-L-alanine amidase
MGNPHDYQFDLPQEHRPADATITDPWYPGVQPLWPSCTTRRSVDPIMGIKAVVIHATAGGSSAGAVSVMKDAVASFHWLVPDEDEPQHGELVWACVPEALAAWHVRNAVSHPDVNDGKPRVNHWSLGIEIVNTQVRDPFSDWQVAATARIVRYCWSKYPNLVHVVSHAKLDPTRRDDPGADFPWDTFAQLVLSGGQTETPAVVARAVPAPQVEGGDGCCRG